MNIEQAREADARAGTRIDEGASEVTKASGQPAETTAAVWYRRNDLRRFLVHIEDPSFGIEGLPAGRCESPLGEIAPPLVEGDTRRLCPTCALTDGALLGTRTMFHRFGS
ncbi:hypothetical protein [Streptomyces griseus]|uniref:hypothetical protein n=1 Tax=Streptomyces griseus TaxID=1911 RepID=UPI0037AA87FC